MPPTDRVEAFIALMGQHQRRLHQFVGSLIPNAADADDVLQETNLVLWREFAKFELGTNFVAWSCAVAFNQILAWRKRRERDRLVFSEAYLAAVADELTAAADRLEDQGRALAGCVGRLPPHHQDLLRRRYTEGQSVEALAAAVGRTTEAVYRMLSRIRLSLHDCVTKSLALADTR